MESRCGAPRYYSLPGNVHPVSDAGTGFATPANSSSFSISNFGTRSGRKHDNSRVFAVI